MGALVKSGLRRFHITSYRSHLMESGYEEATINKKIRFDWIVFNSLFAMLHDNVKRGICCDMSNFQFKYRI